MAVVVNVSCWFTQILTKRVAQFFVLLLVAKKLYMCPPLSVIDACDIVTRFPGSEVTYCMVATRKDVIIYTIAT